MKRNRLGSNFGHAKIPVLRAVHGTNVDALRGGFEILQFCRQAWEQMISELYQGKNAGARWPHLSGDPARRRRGLRPLRRARSAIASERMPAPCRPSAF